MTPPIGFTFLVPIYPNYTTYVVTFLEHLAYQLHILSARMPAVLQMHQGPLGGRRRRRRTKSFKVRPILLTFDHVTYPVKGVK